MRDWLNAPLDALGDGPLTEDGVRRHVFPLFSRVLARSELYFANHSLGRPPDQTALDLKEAIDHWYSDMDGAWEPWLESSRRFSELVGTLIGCAPNDAVVHKMSAGAGLRTVVNACPAKNTIPSIVSTRSEFDAVDTVLRVYHKKGRAKVNWAPANADGVIEADSVIELIDQSTDLVVVSQIFFSTGAELQELDRIISAAHDAGAAVVLDTYHAAGSVPMSFQNLDADFAIGGNYKYTRGGPGAAWLAIRESLVDDERWMPIDTGWFAKADHFGFGRSDEVSLASGAQGWTEGTPGILLPVQAIAGLEFVLGVGVQRLRDHNVSLQDALIDALRAEGLEPRLHEPRGGFILLPVEDPQESTSALRAAGVNVDGRSDPVGRGHLRFCPDVLNTREEIGRLAPIVAQTLGVAAS